MPTPAEEQVTNEVGFALSTFSQAAGEVAAMMDKHGTSAATAGIGVVLMVFCIATRIDASLAALGTTEFIAVLVVGCIFTLIGVAARLYVGIKATDAYRDELGRRVQRAERLEEAGQEAHEGAASQQDRVHEGVPKL